MTNEITKQKKFGVTGIRIDVDESTHYWRKGDEKKKRSSNGQPLRLCYTYFNTSQCGEEYKDLFNFISKLASGSFNDATESGEDPIVKSLIDHMLNTRENPDNVRYEEFFVKIDIRILIPNARVDNDECSHVWNIQFALSNTGLITLLDEQLHDMFKKFTYLSTYYDIITGDHQKDKCYQSNNILLYKDGERTNTEVLRKTNMNPITETVLSTITETESKGGYAVKKLLTDLINFKFLKNGSREFLGRKDKPTIWRWHRDYSYNWQTMGGVLFEAKVATMAINIKEDRDAYEGLELLEKAHSKAIKEWEKSKRK